MRHVSNHVGSKIVLIVMGGLLISLGLPFGSLGVAAEPLEELLPLPSDEFDVAEEHLRLGVDFFLTDELDVAIDEFREAARLKLDYPDAYHNLGVALAKTGDLTGAISAWSKAEQLDPSSMSLQYSLPALVAYNYGVSLVRKGLVEQAIKEWQTALGIQPYFPEAHYALGLGFSAKRNPAVAVSHLRSALSLAPDWVQAYVVLGRAHYESHEYDEARAVWSKALELNPREARIYANLGHLAVEEGNYQDAIHHAQQAIALQPDLIPSHFHLGVAFLAKGQTHAGMKALQHVLALDARFTPAQLLLGIASSRIGNWAQAAYHFREALQQNPFGPETFWLHVNLGMALTSMGHFQDATKEFQWVAQQRPEWAQGWSQLGLALMSERRWSEAVEALEMAIQRKPDWAHLHFSLGNAYAELGEWASAVQAFREAVNIAPDFVDALFHLGIVLRAQNQVSEAIDPLRQAAVGGSREAQGLLASMYLNGNGIDRNVPLAMLWWSRCSRGSIPDTITRTAKNQLTQLRRRLHRQQFTEAEQKDVLTGFALIRQDLANHAPVQVHEKSWSGDTAVWNQETSPKILLQWMVERALALDAMAQNTLQKWFLEGVPEQLPPHHSSLQQYWLQVAKEGDRVGCKLIESVMPKEEFYAVRQACLSLDQ